MAKKFVKENVLPIAVLSVICIVVAALLAGINTLTSPIIEEAKNAAANEALLVVLPDAKNFEEIELTAEFPAEIRKAHKADLGYVFEVDVKGKEAMTVMCGVDNGGKIVKIKVLSEQETPGYKEKVFPYVTGDEGKYNGKDSSSLEAEIFSGATLTSNGVYNAVKASLNAFAVISGGEVIEDEEETVEETLPKTDEEIKAIASEMLEGVTLTDVAIDKAPDTLKRVFSAGDDGYFIYIVVPGEYVPVATEALIHIDEEGKILNNNLLSWIVGNDIDAGDFAERFNGKTAEDVDKVEHVTQATVTSREFRIAVKDALDYLSDYHGVKEKLPRTEDEIKAIAAEMAGKELSLSAFSLMKNVPEELRLAYSANTDGYFLYIVVPGEYVPVATEAVVYLNTDCEIVKVNLLSWVVGHGVEPDGFADRFTGKNKNNIGKVELVAEATGTSSDFRKALEASVVALADGDGAKEVLLKFRMEGIVPDADGFEKTELPENAPDTVKAIYKAVGCDGYVVYVITSTQYVEVETEALVYVNAKGEVGDIYLVTWTVGHGVGAGDFPKTLVGKNASELLEVELVAEATGTSQHLRDAVIDALSVVPTDNTPKTVGIIVLLLSAAAFAVYIVIIKRRRTGK